MKFRLHRDVATQQLADDLAAVAGPRRAEPLAELCGDDEGPLSTPFEDWCEATGTHPEAVGAWELFTAQRRPAS